MKKFTRTITIPAPALPSTALKRAAMVVIDPTGIMREIIEEGPIETAATAARFSPLMALVDPTGIMRAAATDQLFVDRCGRHTADLVDAALDSFERNAAAWWREQREEAAVLLDSMRNPSW